MIFVSGGNFQYLNGASLANGTLLLQLSWDSTETVTTPNGTVLAGVGIPIALDSTGNAPSTAIWSNAELAVPTYYTVRVFDNNGTPVLKSPLIWIFSQGTGSAVDLGTVTNVALLPVEVTVPVPGPTGPTGPAGPTGAPGTSTGSQYGSFMYIIDGGGSVPSTGLRGTIHVPTACHITGWSLIADATGSAVVDVLKSTYAAFPSNTSICSTDRPTLASVQNNENLAVSVWSNSLTAGDVLQMNLVSVTTCKRLCLTLFVSIP